MTPERWQHINNIYHAALELEPTQRAAFLARECQGDLPLEHEINSLLSAHVQAHQFLQLPAAALYSFAQEAAATASSATSLSANPATTANAQLTPALPPARPRFFWVGLTAWLLALLVFVFTCVLAFRYGSTDKFGYRVRFVAGRQIIHEVHAQGPAAGLLQPGDQLVALDSDARFSRVEPFVKLQTLPVGQTYRLRVARVVNGLSTELEFMLPCTSYPRPDVTRWRQIVTHLLRALVSLVVALFFLWLKPGQRFAQIAFGGFLALSVLEPRIVLLPLLEQLTGASRALILLFWSVTGGFPIIPLGYHIAYLLPPGGTRLARGWTALQWLLYGCWAIAAQRNLFMKLGELWQQFDLLYAYAPHFAMLRTFGEWYYALGLLAIALVIIRNYRLTSDASQRRRLKWVIAGSLLAAFAIAALELMRLLLIARGQYAVTTSGQFKLLYWLADLLVLAFPVTWAYALLTRQIYDVHVVVRRSVQYLLARNAMRILLALPMLGLLYHILTNPDRTIREALLSSTLFLLLAGLAALGLLFQRRLSAWVDRGFFRTAYQQEQVLLGLLDELRASDDLPHMVRRVSERLATTLNPQPLYLFFRTAQTSEFRLCDATGALLPKSSLPADAPLVRWLEQAHAVVEVATLTATACTPLERRLLGRLGCRLLVPLNCPDGKLAGLLLLGEKCSEEPYSATDRRLLYAIAQQLALVWEIGELRTQVGAEARVRREVLNRLDSAHLNLLKECPACGACYDSVFEHCADCRTELTLSLPIERTVAGRYRLTRAIGQGGMGAVYQATDLRLGREVALKVLAAALFGNQLALRRFEREARAAARLNHPNVVAVYDHGTTSTGGAWLAMELVEGVTLRAEMNRRKVIEITQLADWFEQLLAGVQAAHDAGVIHRDLKPENILLTGPALAKLRILDFGLARLRQPESELAAELNSPSYEKPASLTQAGSLLGTPGYMSPEQCSGAEADERSDIFALGVLLAELLTGARPFERATYQATLHAILYEPYEPPANAHPVTYNEAALNAVWQKCLAKERQARYRSVAELQAAVLPILRADF